MTEFKPGDKVHVEFDAVVSPPPWSPPGQLDKSSIRVINPVTARSHFFAAEQLTRLSPFIVGLKYIDADGDVFTWSDDGWRDDDNPVGSDRAAYAYRYATRPMRELGKIVEED